MHTLPPSTQAWVLGCSWHILYHLAPTFGSPGVLLAAGILQPLSGSQCSVPLPPDVSLCNLTTFYCSVPLPSDVSLSPQPSSALSPCLQMSILSASQCSVLLPADVPDFSLGLSAWGGG
eukprot:scaffold199730_cov19-Tisochrysis_lutea.AAC.1